MATNAARLEVETAGENTCINLTDEVSNVVKNMMVSDGILNVFIQSTTASVAICENEKGLLQDLVDAATRIFPDGIEYKHNLAWNDENGKSHVKSTFFGQSVSVPVKDTRLQLGTWQSIFLFEFDIRPRKRTVVITLVS